MMKKITIALAVLLFCGTASFAQNRFDNNNNNRKVNYENNDHKNGNKKDKKKNKKHSKKCDRHDNSWIHNNEQHPGKWRAQDQSNNQTKSFPLFRHRKA
ncbi:MAG: hypothetical protein V4556_11090 [Bacteroidota bacterium]